MKTKTLLLLCLFLGIGLTQLSAQPENPQGTGTIKVSETVTERNVDLEIFCDGVRVDILNFSLPYDLTGRIHFRKGEFIWDKWQLKNATFTSKISNEVFYGHDFENSYQNGLFYWSSHLNGSMGHNYNIRMIWDFSTGLFVLVDYTTSCYINPVFPE